MDEWLEYLDKCKNRGWYFEIEPEESERLATDIRKVLTRIEQLEAALRPFANKFLYPDDTDVADYIRDDEDWDEENNNQMIDDVFIPRGWIRAARAVLGEKKDG
jgi:hypothetical protein